jgi:RND family efflux transporter MFP subunit
MTRLRALLVAAIALAILVTLGWLLFGRKTVDAGLAARPQVPVAAVRVETLENVLHVIGRVGPVAGTQKRLAFAVPGTVRSIDVRLGERVEAGETLAHLDPTPYAYAAQAAHADAAAASGGAALASVDRVSVKLRVDEADLRRQERLFSAGIVAQRDVAAAEATVAADRAEAQSAQDQRVSARAQSASAQARAGSSDYDLERTTLRAESAGVVAAIFVQPGEYVDAASSVLAMASTDAHSATLDIAVADIARLAPGDRVRARSGDSSWEGRVAGIAASVDPSTGLALASVGGVPEGVRAGTPVDADVVVGHSRGPVVPLAAVIEDPETGRELVFVQTRGAGGASVFAPREVRLGTQSGGLTIVVDGLRAGERVAAQGAIELLAPPAADDGN